LRATTDQFLIVADGGLRPFDGDLEDYKDWLLKSKMDKPAEKPAAPAAAVAPVKKAAAPNPSAPPASKNLLARVKRLEEMIGRLNAKKSELDARLADAALYRPESKDALQAAQFDQASVAKELGQLEAEWLEKQAALE
jgi:ATP-binding cassette subfamily F protein 3